MGFVFGEVDTELPAAAVPGDTDTNAAIPAVAGRNQLWNASLGSWERERGNESVPVLGAVARTGTTVSPTVANRNCRGLLLLLSVTAASGTGGLTPRLQAVEGSFFANLNPAPPIVTAVGDYAYIFYPGVTGASAQQQVSVPLPRTWRLIVFAGDASSYTYSLFAHLLR